MIEITTEGRVARFDAERHAWAVQDELLTVYELPENTDPDRVWTAPELRLSSRVVAQFRSWSGVLDAASLAPLTGSTLPDGLADAVVNLAGLAIPADLARRYPGLDHAIDRVTRFVDHKSVRDGAT